jgi:uncharacterized protein
MKWKHSTQGIRSRLGSTIEIGMNRDATIQELVRRLVEYYKPERIYLFGSAARGDDRPDSDLDFCVVLPDSADQALLNPGGIHRSILDIPEAVDIFRMRRKEFDRRWDWLVSIPAAVRKEGRLLYASDTGPG